jgi:hypothetical protein
MRNKKDSNTTYCKERKWSTVIKTTKNNQTTVVLEFDVEVKNMLGYLLAPVVKLKIGISA